VEALVAAGQLAGLNAEPDHGNWLVTMLHVDDAADVVLFKPEPIASKLFPILVVGVAREPPQPQSMLSLPLGVPSC